MLHIEQINIFQLEKYCVEIFLNSSNTASRVSQLSNLLKGKKKVQKPQ